MTRRDVERWGDHAADGSDPRGDLLPVTIRIAPDGVVYFHDITGGLVEVALAMNPQDVALRERMRALEGFGNGGPT